ncbi:MAG: serine/threonine protein kinase [Myxococcales bacterium]|nr:serine/threonine protein kinase [Myxococcales bacterium]
MSQVPPTSPYPQPGEVIDGKYKVERVLGQGGMGAVVKAVHLVLRAPVALKFMNPQYVEVQGAVDRFLNEGVASKRIASDHVLHVDDVGKLPSGAPYLVMDCLDGRDLAQVLEAEGKPGLPAMRAVGFVLQILRGLQAAHAAQIIHRDMKPSNCFVIHKDGDDDFVKILDFGISKIQDPGSQSLTQTHSALGTPLYMSAEQARSPKRSTRGAISIRWRSFCTSSSRAERPSAPRAGSSPSSSSSCSPPIPTRSTSSSPICPPGCGTWCARASRASPSTGTRRRCSSPRRSSPSPTRKAAPSSRACRGSSPRRTPGAHLGPFPLPPWRSRSSSRARPSAAHPSQVASPKRKPRPPCAPSAWPGPRSIAGAPCPRLRPAHLLLRPMGPRAPWPCPIARAPWEASRPRAYHARTTSPTPAPKAETSARRPPPCRPPSPHATHKRARSACSSPAQASRSPRSWSRSASPSSRRPPSPRT